MIQYRQQRGCFSFYTLPKHTFQRPRSVFNEQTRGENKVSHRREHTVVVAGGNLRRKKHEFPNFPYR